MKNRVRNLVYASALFSSMILLPCHASQTATPYDAFDSKWWLLKSKDERGAFIDGYLECYTREYKGPDSYSNSWVGYALIITKRYQSNPADDKRSVLQEMHDMRDRPGEWPPEPDAETMPVPTGLEWLQMDMTGVGPLYVQLGFVEGYLACHAELNHSKGGVFSNSADTYIDEISHWYGHDNRMEDMNPAREDTPIAKVLFMFADKPGASKPNGS